MSDIVYVKGNAKTVSPFKIGSTKEHLLTKRLSGIQTGNPIPLDVLQTFLVPPDQETTKFEKWLRDSLVKKFSRKYKHASGEWLEIKTKDNQVGPVKQKKLIDDLKKVLKIKNYEVHKDVTLGYLIEKYSSAVEEHNHFVKQYNKVAPKIFEILEESFDLEDEIKKQDERVNKVGNEIDEFTKDREIEYHSPYTEADYSGDKILNLIEKRVDKEVLSQLEKKYPRFFSTSERKKIKLNRPYLQKELPNQAKPFLRWVRVFYNLFSSVVDNTHWFHSSRHSPYMFKFDKYGKMPDNVTLTFNREDTNTASERWTWSPGNLRIDTEYTVRRESPHKYGDTWLGKFFVGGETYIERYFEERGSKELQDYITLDVGKELASAPPPSNVYIRYIGGREEYQNQHYYSYDYIMKNFGSDMSERIGESVQKFIQQILKEEKQCQM